MCVGCKEKQNNIQVFFEVIDSAVSSVHLFVHWKNVW